MLTSRLQCALALLASVALALSTVAAAPSDPRLRQFLQKSLAAAAGKQGNESASEQQQKAARSPPSYRCQV
uniref:Uncharacterized protein n=1 Tax=Sphaerodactylus townsendi TaxID=933632 RepID=A0ACB8FC61_9SAUR